MIAAVGPLLALLSVSATEPSAETISAWENYVSLTEERIASELAGSKDFLILDFLPPQERGPCQARIRSGAVCIVKRETLSEEEKSIRVPGGMIHHWYGSLFIPGVELDRVLAWVKTYDDREAYYPEVEDSRLVSQKGDEYDVFLRLKRTKLLTAHYNTEHHVTYRNHGEKRASSRSLATRIRELDNPGSPKETEKEPDSDRGFLWRLNSYWRFEERDGGIYVECESVSLSRSIPTGVGWMIESFINSVPKESLESTLLPIRENLSK